MEPIDKKLEEIINDLKNQQSVSNLLKEMIDEDFKTVIICGIKHNGDWRVTATGANRVLEAIGLLDYAKMIMRNQMKAGSEG